jgi:hypothetical protein
MEGDTPPNTLIIGKNPTKIDVDTTRYMNMKYRGNENEIVIPDGSRITVTEVCHYIGDPSNYVNWEDRETSDQITCYPMHRDADL